MKKIRQYLDTCSDAELEQLIVHCMELSAHADPEVRRMARRSLLEAREEQYARALLRGLPNGKP